MNFTDPNELNEEFGILEEKNLYLINQSQDLEQSLESQKQLYAYLQQKLGKELELHMKNKNDLREQIEESKKNLYELQKRNNFSNISQGSGNDKDKGDVEINIEDLLNDLKKDIFKVYKNTLGKDQSDLHGKQPIDMLCVRYQYFELFIGH